MGEDLKKSSFDPYLNETFEVMTESAGTVEVELVEVSEHNRENLESFSLLFRGPRDSFFDQDLYKVKHPRMGELDLFLVPVVQIRQDAFYYEAAFSRLLERSS